MTQKQMLRFMRDMLPTLIFLLILFFFVGWWYNATANRRYLQRVYIPIEDQYDVIGFGDSLIEGIGATQSRGFITILSERLGVPIHNAGVRRNKTFDAVERLENDVLRFSPKLVIVSIGGNDSIRGVPPEETFANIREIVDRIKASGAEVFLLGISGKPFSEEYTKLYPPLVFETGIYFYPNILEDIYLRPAVLFDPIHPNDKGHALIADKLEPILRNILTELDIPHTPYITEQVDGIGQ